MSKQHIVKMTLTDGSPFGYERGWQAPFTRAQAAGALPNGTRVIKCNSEPKDKHADGTRATVLGSIASPEVMGGMVMYFVEWETHPRVAVACLQTKLRPANA